MQWSIRACYFLEVYDHHVIISFLNVWLLCRLNNEPLFLKITSLTCDEASEYVTLKLSINKSFFTYIYGTTRLQTTYPSIQRWVCIMITKVFKLLIEKSLTLYREATVYFLYTTKNYCWCALKYIVQLLWLQLVNSSD